MSGSEFGVIVKAVCCISGYKQEFFYEFASISLYNPVLRNETIRMCSAKSVAQNLSVEGADISNAYFCGDIDLDVHMK